jgi:hypothetical protein
MWYWNYAADLIMYTSYFETLDILCDKTIKSFSKRFGLLKIGLIYEARDLSKEYLERAEKSIDWNIIHNIGTIFDLCALLICIKIIAPTNVMIIVLGQLIINAGCLCMFRAKRHKVYDPSNPIHFPLNDDDDEMDDPTYIQEVDDYTPFKLANGNVIHIEIPKKIYKRMVFNEFSRMVASLLIGSLVGISFFNLSRTDLQIYQMMGFFASRTCNGFSGLYDVWHKVDNIFQHYYIMEKNQRVVLPEFSDEIGSVNSIEIDNLHIGYVEDMFTIGHDQYTEIFTIPHITFNTGVTAIIGDNESGKSTFMKSIFRDSNVKYNGFKRSTDWLQHNMLDLFQGFNGVHFDEKFCCY